VSSAEGHHNGQELEHLPCEERLRELGLLSLEREQFQIIQKMEPGSLQWCYGDRMTGNGSKLRKREGQISQKEKLFHHEDGNTGTGCPDWLYSLHH